MASSNSSTALVKRNSVQDVAAMPPPPFKRIKRPPKVLDEDEYTSALSDIIARDYFPGLLESQAQHEYLAALDSENDSWIAEAAQKLRDAAAPTSGSKRRSARNTKFDGISSAAATPLRTQGVADTPLGYTGSETPVTLAGSEVGDDVSSERENLKSRVDASALSLGAFQAKYTSEDNESFNALLDKQNYKRREKHAYLWTQDQRIPSARQIAYRAHEARLLKEREELEEATGKELVLMTTGATASRPAKPDAWQNKRPDNTFMFNASSVDEDGLQTVQEVKEQNSKAGPKHVVHANTRFPSMLYVDDPGPVPPSPSLNTDIIARRDAARHKRAGADTDTETESEFTGGETPRVNGYAFVDEDEPENVPVENTAPSFRDLLAGQVGDATPNPFKISENGKREDLHMRMLDRQAKRQREKDRQTARPADIAATPAGNMTPAARRLMDKLGGRTPVPTDTGHGHAKDMWTPGRTPRRSTAVRK
ncbi:sepiapterin reductase [Exophiala viscosa]|uniref:Sepiapterin reductase n=1 Tax=Exophiala viscosa TaxID=2486360 RepID=A0AAN6ICN7_9EURO|nr:sepiapterin reductase [Exophiala viscosa]